MLSLRKYVGKQLVSYLRGDDFAHAGEAEAIELVMGKFKKSQSQQILDVGCGLGGTAKYIQDQGWGTVTGLDIEEESIKYAISHYPSIDFYVTDVVDTDQLFRNKQFDMVCLFNSFYAFDNQELALLSLSKIARKGSTLAIFDYSIPSLANKSRLFKERSANRSPFKPVVVDEFDFMLKLAKWDLIEKIDISEKYIRWYDSLINKLASNKSKIIDLFGIRAYKKAYSTYSGIYNSLNDKSLGGIIIYAEKAS